MSDEELEKKANSGRRKKWWRRSGSKAEGWRFVTSQGAAVTDQEQIARVQSIAIPPAWRFVRICPTPSGKVQATGIDALGRLQYIYHSKFRERAQKKKYSRLLDFGEMLPDIRSRVASDLKKEGMPREKVVAVIIRLIDDLYFRMGSELSVERYKTFGITTLRKKHVKLVEDGKTAEFDFIGKHHIRRQVRLEDGLLASTLAELKSIRGTRIFHFIDPMGKVLPVSPRDVNDYIKSATSAEFSAKDFRTWGGTLHMAIELAELGITQGVKSIKKNIVRAAERVASHLGNTPTIARKSYIHPGVITAYEKGKTLADYQRQPSRLRKRLNRSEAALLKLLKKGR